MEKDPDAQWNGSEKRDLLKEQAEIRNTAGQFEERSRDRVSEYKNQGRSREAGKPGNQNTI